MILRKPSLNVILNVYNRILMSLNKKGSKSHYVHRKATELLSTFALCVKRGNKYLLCSDSEMNIVLIRYSTQKYELGLRLYIQS
jgi:hypothetical protein